jgi:5-methyltetrahydropteroyltriglutamate--homocysteine methyltransferase
VNRIRTTHAGSLPRPHALTQMLVARFEGRPVDTAQLDAVAREATDAVVRRQHEIGLDSINNGEVARDSFFTYVATRMTGFSGKSDRPPMRDLVKYADFLGYLRRTAFAADSVSLGGPPAATGAVRYRDTAAIERECAELAAALARVGRTPSDAFVSVPSPGIVAVAMENRHYRDLDAYLVAVTEALAVEMRVVLERGFDLQIDAPDLAMERHTYFADRPLGEFLAFVARVGELLNRALAGVPRERIRLHVCWGNYEGPHDEDVPLSDIYGALCEIRAGALLLSMANPRHAHEYRVVADMGLPEGTTLVAGVIDTTTNYIEHPDVVADRLVSIADALGASERLMAGTDCGFETSAGFSSVVDEIAWQKLAALVEGARRAEARLFGRRS